MVKDNGDMRGRIAAFVAFKIAEQNVAKPRHRAHRQAVGFPRQRRQRVIGPEDIGRSVDQVQVVAFAKCHLALPAMCA